MSETRIFNAEPITTESWSLQGAVVEWGQGSNYGPNEIPLIMNQINVRFGVPVSTFTPLNTGSGKVANRILIKGVPEGTFTVQSIFTPDVGNFSKFIKACQEACKTKENQVNISIRPFGTLKCNNQSFKPGGIVFYLEALDLRQFDFTITQQDQIAMTNMPLTFQFFGLEFDEGSSNFSVDQSGRDAAVNDALNDFFNDIDNA